MKTVHIPQLRWEESHSPRRTFHSFFQNISLGLGGVRNGGTWCGGHPFDVQIRRVPAGAAICPFHSHLAQWELFLVRKGVGRVRTADAVHTVRSGDVFVHPPGEPHQLSNAGDTELEVLIVADNPELDGFHYPDSNKWGLRPPGRYFRISEVGYFDGEENPQPGAAPYQPSGFPPAPTLSSFADRTRNVDELPWEDWSSPKRKFVGRSKELSIALGAKRNTPTGLGGHPFDVELNRLGPRACGCPFHSHAAQWEMFIVEQGTAVIRAGDEAALFGAGDVVLHPPGEAHQITNASEHDELVYLLISDNPAVDYFHYPDSKKWGLRSPRMFFRASEVDYWDGEE